VIKDKDTFLYDVLNHDVHKNILIELIKKIPRNKLNQVSHQDHNIPPSMIREWANYFWPNIYHHFREEFCDMVKGQIQVTNAWFQWYEKNDFHEWHVHEGVHFTNIYYLSLPNKDMKTVVKDLDGERSIYVKEGQILTLPAYWKHRSPPNKYNEPKIIISFNTILRSEI
jgi:hypothetical protein